MTKFAALSAGDVPKKARVAGLWLSAKSISSAKDRFCSNYLKSRFLNVFHIFKVESLREYAMDDRAKQVHSEPGRR